MTDLNNIRPSLPEAPPLIDESASAHPAVGTKLAEQQEHLIQAELNRRAAESLFVAQNKPSKILNQHGALQLAPPLVNNVDLSDLTVFVGKLMLDTNNMRQALLQTTLEDSSKQIELKNKEQREALDATIRTAAKQIEAEKANWLLSLLSKAVTLVAATIVTVASAGTLGPIAYGLAVATAVYTAVDLSLQIADKMSTALGGPRLSLDALMAKAVQFFAEVGGATKEKAKEIAQWVTLALTVAIGVASAVGVMSITRAVQAAVQVAITAANSVLALSSAAAGIGAGTINYQASNLQADKTDIEAAINRMKQFLGTVLDEVKLMNENLISAFGTTMDTLAQINQGKIKIVKNIA